jgi:UDP-GlcNAc:undecaprenyl-phosphate GlcNAc-1-phosphate transferase
MPDLAAVFLGFFLSLIISFSLTPLARNIALRKGMLSRPGERTVHTEPVPYLGGLAIYFSFILGVLVVCMADQNLKCGFHKEIMGLFLGGTLIVLLGLWDDIKNIRPLTKLAGQIVVALVLFGFGFRVEFLTNLFSGQEMHVSYLLSVFFTVVWIVGLINAMNLIDGLDGLAAGITVIAAWALVIVAVYLQNYLTMFLLAVLAGSVLGFLPYNFHPAKIFMGDSGSMFLGLVLASVTLIKSQHKSAAAVVLLTPITALVIPIYDTFVAIVRRAFKKESIFKADKKHLHHRLLAIGLGQGEIVLFIYMVTLYLGIFAFLFVLIPKGFALILLILLLLGLLMGVRVIGYIERIQNKTYI